MEKSGFFNAKLIDGVYDRLYNADDYRGNLGAIISNGVRRSGDDDLKVTAEGDGLSYSVKSGRAWINGAWYHLTEPHTGIVPTPNVSLPRKDRIVLEFNRTDEIRNIHLSYLQGEPSNSPVSPTLTQNDDIFQICLAEILVGANAGSISQSAITDTRDDKELCGWITSPVGYDDFFTSVDGKVIEHINILDEEWNTMKDQWASVTLFKKYEDSIIVESNTMSVVVPITQYDPSVDILEIYVNGIYAKENEDYTLDGTTVNFTLEKTPLTEINFTVFKSIDSRGDIASFLSILTDLQNQMADLNNMKEYRYMATGIDDNIKLSQMCQAFFDGTDDGNEIKINIYGNNFKAVTPYQGEGSSANRYKWFSVSPTGTVSRKITLDFSNCNKITLPVAAGSYNIVFYGKDMTVIGASIEAKQLGANTAMEVFSSTNGNIKASKCRFNLEGYHKTFIAETGTFEDCIASCSVETGEGYCFYTHTEGLLRINSGEYKAYTKASSSNAMVVKQIDSGAVVVMYAVNCPTVAKSGYRQTHAINASGGTAIARDTITQLTVTAGTVSTIINANKPYRG